MRRPSIALAAIAVTATLGLTACAGGGASDAVAAAGTGCRRGAATSTINLYAYAVPKVGFDKVIPLFQKTTDGQGRAVPASPTAPRATSRARSSAAAEADVVNFSVEPDVTRLVDAGLVDADWNAERAQGHPVRLRRHDRRPQGQPQGHQGLGRPAQAGRRGRHAEPVLAPARAKWNLLAPYADKSNGGNDPRPPASPTSRKLDRRPRQGPAEVRPRGDRDVPAGHRRRAAQLRERGALRREATATRSSTSRPPRRSRSRTRSPCSTQQEPRAGQAFVDFLYTPEAPEARAPRPASARSTRRSPRSSPRTSRRRRSSGRSTTSAAGASVDGDALRDGRSAPSPRSTTRRPVTLTRPARGTSGDGAAPLPPRRTRRARGVRRPAAAAPRPAPAAVGPAHRPGLGAARHRRRHAVAERHRPAAARGADRRRRSTTASPGFWDAITAPAALASLWVTVLVSVDRRADQRRHRHADRLGARARRLPRQALRQRDHRPAVRAADDRREHRAALASTARTARSASTSTRRGRRLVVALLFVTLPFVVRSVQPVLIEVDREVEEAAASLGAGNWTTFRRDRPAGAGPGDAQRRRPRLRPRDRRVRLRRADRRQHPARDRRSPRSTSSSRSRSTGRSNAAAVSVALLAIAFVDPAACCASSSSRSQRREERDA